MRLIRRWDWDYFWVFEPSSRAERFEKLRQSYLAWAKNARRDEFIRVQSDLVKIGTFTAPSAHWVAALLVDNFLTQLWSHVSGRMDLGSSQLRGVPPGSPATLGKRPECRPFTGWNEALASQGAPTRSDPLPTFTKSARESFPGAANLPPLEADRWEADELRSVWGQEVTCHDLSQLELMLKKEFTKVKFLVSVKNRSWDAATEARNKWIYEQVMKCVPWKEIAEQLAKSKENWRRIRSVNGIKEAALAYALKHDLPQPRPRRHGRPRSG